MVTEEINLKLISIIDRASSSYSLKTIMDLFYICFLLSDGISLNFIKKERERDAKFVLLERIFHKNLSLSTIF
jgi:hypothetical protein